MICLVRLALGSWGRIAAVGLLAVSLTGRTARADYPGAATLRGAASTSNDSLLLLEARQAREKSTLEKLLELQSRGHASWREVAKQRVAVASLQADGKAASQFSAFVTALRQRAEW